ncbi:hypothetical protein ACOME3_010231 [Neoechinorhynchus agilis]
MFGESNNIIASIEAMHLGESPIATLAHNELMSELKNVLQKHFSNDKEQYVSGPFVNVQVSEYDLRIIYKSVQRPDQVFPIKFLIYTGAIRKVLMGSNSTFETLDNIFGENRKDVTAVLHPPLLVLIFKGFGNYICHVLATNNDSDALKIVNVLKVVSTNPAKSLQQFTSVPTSSNAASRVSSESTSQSTRADRIRHSSSRSSSTFNTDHNQAGRFIVRTEDGSILNEEEIRKNPNIMRALNLADQLIDTNQSKQTSNPMNMPTGAPYDQHQQNFGQNPPNIFVKYMDNNGDQNDEEDEIVIRERNSRYRQPSTGVISNPLVVERWLPSCNLPTQCEKPTKFILPLTVKEVKLITPKPIVIQQLRPVFKTRKRVVAGGESKTTKRSEDRIIPNERNFRMGIFPCF